jgi:transcriptional regulator with XRE-family HTH domain
MTDFGTRLRMAMAYADISMRDLAADLGVSTMAVSKWAKGKCYPRSSHLIGISERCRVTIDWLMEPGNPFTGQDRIDALRRELKEALNELDMLKGGAP